MIRHIVCWCYKDDLTEQQKKEAGMKIKKDIENLINLIDGIISLEVIPEQLPSSSTELVLNSLFADEKALANYQVHEEHVKVAQFIASVTKNRSCIDYIEN